MVIDAKGSAMMDFPHTKKPQAKNLAKAGGFERYNGRAGETGRERRGVGCAL